VLVVGESVSINQGWVEGALKSVEFIIYWIIYESFHHALRIVDFINYLYNKYNIPVQPETIMHFHLLDKNIDLNYMDNHITIVR
jgi:hypothetical protein